MSPSDAARVSSKSVEGLADAAASLVAATCQRGIAASVIRRLLCEGLKSDLVRVLLSNRPNVAATGRDTERLAYNQQDGCHAGALEMFLNVAIPETFCRGLYEISCRQPKACRCCGGVFRKCCGAGR